MDEKSIWVLNMDRRRVSVQGLEEVGSMCVTLMVWGCGGGSRGEE